ncbi:MAG: HRDC domain-containing protein, partial [bacterium]
LEEMVRYGESNGCRRKILLSHFGDDGEPTNQFGCCDNCGQSTTATAQLDPMTREILSLVQSLDGKVGRTKIAQILNGSLARDMQRFKKHPSYGRLSHFSQDETIKKIDWLVENSFLKLVGGHYPTVRITPKGKAWLLRPQALAQPETIPSTQFNNLPQKEQQRQEGGGVSEAQPEISPPPDLYDLAILPLRRWRDKLAAKLGIPYYFLLSETKLHQIAKAQPKDIQALRKLGGLSEEFLDQHGEIILAIITGYHSNTLARTIWEAVRDKTVEYSSRGLAKNIHVSKVFEEYSMADLVYQIDCMAAKGILKKDLKKHLVLGNFPGFSPSPTPTGE